MHFDDLIIEFYERLRCLQKIVELFGNEGSLLMFANKAGSTLGSVKQPWKQMMGRAEA